MPPSIAHGRKGSGSAESAPWRVEQRRRAASANAPWRVDTAKRQVVEWCHQPKRRRGQAPKPKGDTRPWQPRTRENVKNVGNVRRGLRHQLALAIWWVDSQQPGDEEEASINLEKQYRKMYYLDELDVIIEDGKGGGPETHNVMTAAQVQRNNELRAKESAPAIKTWYLLRKRGEAGQADLRGSTTWCQTAEAHDGRRAERGEA